MNAHSTMWNSHCYQKINASFLKELVESYKLILNNNTDFPIHPSGSKISIINLALTSFDLGPLRIWEILRKFPSVSDYELILLRWEEIQTLS